MSLEKRIAEWLRPPFDEETQKAVAQLTQNPKEAEEAFYTSLKFGTGGMRGIMGVGTNRINKYTLGKSTQGLSRFLKQKYEGKHVKVVIAYDCRNNSRSLAITVANVFTANGIYCYLFKELRPTPQLSFMVRHLEAHCGIVLTASHNPPKYNGYKVYGKDGGQLVPPDDKAIIKEIEQTSFQEILFEGNSTLLEYLGKKADSPYHKTVLQEATMHGFDRSKLKIVFTPIHGTSITAIPQVLEKAGYKNITIVKEQEQPDGDFPTVVSPNPEEHDALKMAVNLAENKKADLVIGTDPDADRLGIVIKDSNQEWYYLNGNQIMVVLTEYLLSKKQAKNELSKKHFIASTIVSTPMIEKIAAAYQVQLKKCLTGFKWIAKLIEDHPELEFIGGGEESYGFLVGSQVRDKDAVSASLLMCELASELQSQGKTVYDYLMECYSKYGIFYERLHSLTKEGKKGAQKIKAMMNQFRINPPKSIGLIPVKSVSDYLNSTRTELLSSQNHKIDLPKADVLLFHLEDGSQIALRPSGTEPKIKFYFSVQEGVKEQLPWKKQQEKLDHKIDLFIKELIY